MVDIRRIPIQYRVVLYADGVTTQSGMDGKGNEYYSSYATFEGMKRFEKLDARDKAAQIYDMQYREFGMYRPQAQDQMPPADLHQAFPDNARIWAASKDA